MLELQNVSKFYTTNGVTNLGLRNINLKFNLGEIVAITGDSGSGKSTLLNVIAKIDTFDEGEIYYKGNETSYFSIKDMDDFRKNKIGFIFQNYNIIDSYTVLENVMVPLFLKGLSKKEAASKATALINRVGLAGKEKNRGSKLSGGEKQRCVIARALASDCEILICDEPTGNLDSKNTKEIVNLIKEVATDKLVLIVTHNFEDFKDIVTRKITISDGEVLEDVTFEKIPADENVALNLDYVPLKTKIDLKIATNNIIFTPRKSLFLLIIFLFINLFTIFLFSSITIDYNDLYYNSGYLNKQANRVYIYSGNKKPIDPQKIKTVCDKTVANPFHENQTLHLVSEQGKLLCQGFYNQHLENYKLKDGRLPKAENEIFVIVPTDSDDKLEVINCDVTQLVGEKTFLYDNSVKDMARIYLDAVVVGYGESSEIDECIFLGTNKLESMMKQAMTDFQVYYKLFDPWNYLEDRETQVDINEVSSPYSFTIHIPKTYPKENWYFEIIMNEIYQITDYEVVIDESLTDRPEFYYSPTKLDENQVFEMSAYANNTIRLKKDIERLGYRCDVVKTYNQGNALQTFITNITKYLSMLASSLILIIIFFITYFILAKVYASKKRDYEILRTLGVTKKDMSRIVIFEVLLIGLVSWITSFILYIVLTNTINTLYKYKDLEFLTIIIFFIVSMVFAYAVARRFNRRLFKFSVNQSLKDGE